MDSERLCALIEDYGDGDPNRFIRDTHDLVYWLKLEIDSHHELSKRQKPPSRWDADWNALLKLLRGLDPRMVANINREETNLWGQGPNSIGRLITVLEGGIDKSKPWEMKARHTCMLLVAGHCRRWNLTVEKSRLCGFYELMEIVKPELGVDWDTYGLADIIIPLYQRFDG